MRVVSGQGRESPVGRSGLSVLPSDAASESVFGSGQRTPERTLTLNTSPVLTDMAQWIGWQAGWDRRFWPHMTQRCADQDDLEHGVLQLGCGAEGRRVIHDRIVSGFHRSAPG